MPSRVFSPWESQLLGWLGKKGQNKMDVASGCAFRDLAKSVGSRACPAAQQACGWHWLFLCVISAGIVGKHDGVLASSGSRETEERRQLLPAHTPAPCGGSVCPSPGQAERGEQTGLRPGGGRDHVSS